jgi:hypothetical protein
MPKYFLHIKDGKEAEIDIDAQNAHDAMNSGLNALSKFACKAFPPPENVSILISDAERKPIGTLKFAFEIDYAPGVRI